MRREMKAHPPEMPGARDAGRRCGGTRRGRVSRIFHAPLGLHSAVAGGGRGGGGGAGVRERRAGAGLRNPARRAHPSRGGGRGERGAGI